MMKDIIVAEYVERRADVHNKWVAESEKLWNVSRVKLPYPPIPDYPTEHDVIRRAQAFIEFLKNNEVYPTPISELQANAKNVVEPVLETCEPTPAPTSEPILEVEIVEEVKAELPKDDLVERLRGLLESRKLVTQ